MEKVRMVLLVVDEIRDAIRLESALAGKDMADIVEDLVRKHLPDALRQIQARRAAKEKKKQKDDD